MIQDYFINYLNIFINYVYPFKYNLNHLIIIIFIINDLINLIIMY
jgi:hypothetical protein